MTRLFRFSNPSNESANQALSWVEIAILGGTSAHTPIPAVPFKELSLSEWRRLNAASVEEAHYFPVGSLRQKPKKGYWILFEDYLCSLCFTDPVRPAWREEQPELANQPYMLAETFHSAILKSRIQAELEKNVEDDRRFEIADKFVKYWSLGVTSRGMHDGPVAGFNDLFLLSLRGLLPCGLTGVWPNDFKFKCVRMFDDVFGGSEQDLPR